MTQEEYEAEIQKLADLTLKISKIINTAVSGSNETISGTLAGQIVENVKTEIMANGEGALDGFNAHSVKTTISDISSNNTDASAQSVLDKMSDSAKFETEVATVESITESIRSSVKSAVEDKSKAQETASTLATVVCNFAGAVESAIDENGNMDIAKFDFAKVADAVTALQNSNLKEVGSSVLDLVISGDLGEGGEIVSNTIGALKDSYNNGEDIGGTINSAGALIVLGTTMGNGGDGSKENIANSFKDLVQNLNETTLNLLATVLSEESLVSMGVEKAYAAIAYDVVDALLRELMELKNSSNYENEVNTVLSIYDILSAGNIEEAQIGDLIRQVLKSQVVMNTLDRVSTDILSADLLISLNVPKDFADEICTAVTICVDEMLAIRNSDAAAYNAEIDALVTMFMSLEGKDKGDQLADVLREMLKSNVIMNMLDKAAHDILSPEFLVSLDVPEKYAKEICTAVVGCLDEMLELRNTDTAAYNAEIDALIATFVSLEDKDLNEDENLAELFRQIFDSKVVMNMLDKVASDVLTANLLTSMNVPEQYAEDVCTVIETLVKELTVLGTEESYTYDNEVNAILVVKKLVNKTNGGFTKDDINSLIDCAKNSEAIYNTLMKISGSVVIEISEADRESVINGIESYYAESQKTEKDRNIFNSVAKILGVTVNLQ